MKITTEGTIPDYPAPYNDAPLLKRVTDLEAAVLALQGAAPVPPVIPPVTPTGTIFSPTSFWYKKLADNAPIHADSARFVTDLVRQTKKNGSTGWNIGNILFDAAFAPVEYASPVYIVTDPAVPKVSVKRLDDGKVFQVRIPANARPGNPTDSPMAIIDKVDNVYTDGWVWSKVGSSWQFRWGGQIPNMSASSGIFSGNDGATATGLPHAGFLIKLSELKAGVIPHVIGIQTAQTPDRHVAPAVRHDNRGPWFPATPPEGTMYRLPANVFIDPSWPPLVRMVAVALRDYGAVQYDRAFSVVIPIENTAQYGESPDQFCGGKPHWDTSLFKMLPISKLQVLQ